MKLTKERRLAMIAEWETRITQKGLARKYGIKLNSLRAILFRAAHSARTEQDAERRDEKP